MIIEVRIVIDGRVALTQLVSRETLDEQIYPILEEEANR